MKSPSFEHSRAQRGFAMTVFLVNLWKLFIDAFDKMDEWRARQ